MSDSEAPMPAPVRAADRADPPRTLAPRARDGLLWLERALFLFGAVCLGWAAWVQIDTVLFQSRALAALSENAADASGERSAGAGPIAHGTPLAHLNVPRLELSAAVAEGTNEGVLRHAVGHLARSDLPGETGHVVLAAHRDTFFRPLENTEIGDLITLDTTLGTHAYRVTWIRVVEPTDLWVLEDPGYPSLTLVTCYPFRYVGAAPERFIVRAYRVDTGALPSQAIGGDPSEAEAPAQERVAGDRTASG